MSQSLFKWAKYYQVLLLIRINLSYVLFNLLLLKQQKNAISKNKKKMNIKKNNQG